MALSNELEKGKGEERVVKWDESNLREHELSVLRGEYGTMRIDEPKTPFAAPGSPAASDDEGLEHLYLSSRGGAADQGASASSGEGRLTLDSLVAHVPSDASLDPTSLPRTRFMPGPESGAKREPLERSASLEHRNPEEQKKQKKFEEKRRMHYNMREALQRSRQMIEEEMRQLEEEEEEEEE